MKVWLKLVPRSFVPIRAVEWVVALCTLISPLYVFSPFYVESVQTSGLGVVASALANEHLIYLYAAILLTGVVCVLIGLKWRKPKIKSIGWFTVLLIRFFQVLTTILAVGLFPTGIWLFPFTVMCVVAVLWVNARIEVGNGRT